MMNAENSDPQLLPAPSSVDGGGGIGKATRVFGNILSNDDDIGVTDAKPEVEPVPTARASTDSTRSSSSSNRSSSGSNRSGSSRSKGASIGSSTSSSKHSSPENMIGDTSANTTANEDANNKSDSLCYSPSPLIERLQLTDKSTTPRDLSFGAAGVDGNSPNDQGNDDDGSSNRFDRRKGYSRSNSAPTLTNRRNLVAQTQRSITRGGIGGGGIGGGSSVNHSINAARSAKQSHLLTHQSKMAQVRSQRQEQKMDAEAFHAEAERMRREALAMQRQLSAKFAKARAQREAANKTNRLNAISREVEFKAKVYRDHQATNKELEDRRRRKSSQVKSLIWAERRENTERMRMDRIEEDKAWMEERNLGSVAAREYARDEAEKRRQSKAFRNADARRIREEEEQRRAEEMHEESQSIQLKLAGERDADAYRRQMAEERRRSLAFRNAEGKRIRDEEEQRRAEEMRAEHESVEMKLAGERDADAYRRQMAEERRKSLAFRNAEGHRIREEEEQRRAEELHAEHESIELKLSGERDADAYRKQMAEERRKSYEFRHRDGHRQREEEEQRRAEEMAAESESIQLKLASERDADAYRKQMAEERRKSYEFRHREGHRQREEEEQRRAEEIVAESESIQLKLAGEHDADAYRRQLAEERRKSYEFRHREGHRQREEVEQRRAEEMAAESESIQLKLAGERDADAYRRQCAEERRKSYEFRHREGHRQREEEEQRRAEEIVAESESIQLRLAGERDADAYRKQLAEERRQSLAFRNKEGRKHRAVMEELHSLVQEKEHESFLLKWAGEKDAEAYLAEEEEKRRESLRLRNAEGRRHREIEEEEHVARVQAAYDDEQLKAGGDRDVKAYREAQAARDRASFQFRLKESRIQRMEAENRRQEEFEEKQKNIQLEDGARADLREYVEECKRRRRLSLAYRAKEKRNHFSYLKKKREESIEQHNLATRARALDQKYVELAKQRERAEEALLSIRHRAALNPFSNAGIL